MNRFRGVLRYLEHIRRVKQFTHNEPVLDPQRLVNRVMYRTDYHPEDVAFQLTNVFGRRDGRNSH